jgi:translation initiation factor 2B subunit (eIF-2B alpha/beta/delta family)
VPDQNSTHIVTCFLRNRGEILLFRRSDNVGSYSGQWGAVAGHAEGDPDGAAREEIREESGLGDAVSFVHAGEPFDVEDGDTHWIVHPYLFDSDSRAVETNYETTEFEWASPTEIRRRETVPDLWKSYEHVAPTVDTVKADTDHGSAWLSVRALEVLRDHAGVLATTDADGDGWDDLAALAADLRAARPSMTVIGNRINRAMADANDDRTPAAVERTAMENIERALDADAAAAHEAADLLDKTVLTLSRSGTVLDALHQAETEEIVVAESRPAREGVGVAEELAADCTVTLAVDAAAAHVLAERPVTAVLVGADTILPDGSVLNKVGTRAIAIAAAHEDVPVYAVAATDKISTDDEADFADGNRAAVYDGDSDVDVTNPTFDRTPPEFVTVVTEDGPLDPERVADHADELRTLASWSQEPSSEPR